MVGELFDQTLKDLVEGTPRYVVCIFIFTVTVVFLVNFLPTHYSFVLAPLSVITVIIWSCTVLLSTFISPSPDSLELLRSHPIFMYISLLTHTIIFPLLVYTRIYRLYGLIHLGTDNVIKAWPTCLYFSSITITTLGFGDLAPCGYAKFFAASESFFGYIFLGAIIAVIVNVESMTIRRSEAEKEAESRTGE